MDIINRVSNVFKTHCNYKTINALSSVKMRCKSEGIRLKDCILYRLLYSQIGTTKEGVVSRINHLNNTSFTRQAFDCKENNIPLAFYALLFDEISLILNNQIENIGISLTAVDGVCNNDRKRKVQTNIGFFDISKNIPIDINFYDSRDRNNEVRKLMKYVANNLDTFKSTIFVCDRIYFEYSLIDFFLDNNLRFIIRIKGPGKNIDPMCPLKKRTSKYAIIDRIRSKLRVVNCKRSYIKKVLTSKRKMKREVKNIAVRSDCMLVTNLIDKRTYSNKTLLDFYKKRWDIEIFFKLLKSNFKFQHLDEISDINYQKLYYCELIMIFILKAVEKYYWKDMIPINCITKRSGVKAECVESINKSHAIKGIFQHLVDKIIYGSITKNDLDNFCRKDVIKTKSEKGRSFPRTSITPFTKWNIKGYSDISKYSRVTNAVENGTISKLDKNLKVLAKNVKILENG